MAKRRRSPSRKTAAPARRRPLRRVLRWFGAGLAAALALLLLAVAFHAVSDPRVTPYMTAEARRLGGVEHRWVPMTRIAPVMARAAVAAEDANFCTHWGFDMAAIRAAMQAGGRRGASTITQQVVKNTYLWHGRSWPRKALEALMTPLVEAVWSKRRIVEIYLNVAEFDEGVFGVGAAARHHFGVAAADLTPDQAARLAAVLPNPKGRDAANLSPALRQRAARIRDGAATIAADGRAACIDS